MVGLRYPVRHRILRNGVQDGTSQLADVYRRSDCGDHCLAVSVRVGLHICITAYETEGTESKAGTQDQANKQETITNPGEP